MRSTAGVVAILLFIACGGRDAQRAQSPQPAAPAAASAPAALTPEQLGELGAQIRKEPSRAEELLAARGLDEKSFEKAIRDVTENPDASKRYADAYRKASS
jgi:hypothetical protein